MNLSLCKNSSIDGRVQSVINLWKKNRSTLGLFPKGAFEEHAERGWIIYLLYGDKVVGYLLYRIAKERAVITHLCVEKNYRGIGGAKKLFEFLRSEIDDGYCRGVEVKCRQDYDMNPLWSKLNFNYIDSVSGRAKNATTLVKWFFHFDIYDFFYDMMPRLSDDDAVWAVLDANVVFKLSQPHQKQNLESATLLSDTVSPYTRYWITPELHSEIERRNSSKEKNESHSYAKRFDRVEVPRGKIDYYKNVLSSIWENLTEPRDQSDLMHIVHTAAAGIPTFITQDNDLLAKADFIFDRCGLHIVRPVDFITGLDTLENENKYKSFSIAGTQYSVKCPLGKDAKDIAKIFVCADQGEKQSQLEAKIRSAIANVHNVSVIINSEGNYLVLLIEEKNKNGVSISLIRQNGSPIAKFLIQNLIWKRLSEGGDHQTKRICIVDPYVANETLSLFSQRGFFKRDKTLERYSLKQVTTKEHAHSEIINLFNKIPIKNKSNWIKNESILRLEEAFFPLKIEDAPIPTFLVPIKPTWAIHLFDEELASQELLGADPNRFFNWQNVYYRSFDAIRFTPGMRILWYVSRDKSTHVSEIRACSRLIIAETGSAKTLYKKYRRIGIYQWHDLIKLTKGDLETKLMAINFYQTECFKVPIELKNFKQYGIKGPPYSPRYLTNKQFCQIYKKGMNLYD